eukprot:s6454_g1.t1
MTQDEADVDLAVEAVFGNLAKDSAKNFAAALMGQESERPPKAAKLELGKRGKPSDSSHVGGRNSQGQGSKGQGKGNKTSPQLTTLVKAMARLAIRQETQLQILKQNSAWLVYLQPGTNGPIPVLFRAAEQYKELAKVKFMEAPVRAVTPVPHQELIGLITRLADLVTHRDVIHRFNATHPISADKEGTSTFMLETGLRAKGVEDTWAGLEKIASLAALQIVGMQIRREGLRRGGLANEVVSDVQKDKMVFSILVILVGSDVQKDKMVFSILVILVGSDVQKDKMVFSILVILVVSAAQKDKMVFSIMVILVGPAVQKGKMDFSIKVILVVSDVQKGKMDFSIKVILVVSDMQKGKMDFSIKVILVVSDVQKGKMDFSIKVILVVSDLQKGKMDFSIKVILVALVKCRVSLLKALNLTCLQDFSMSEAHMIKQKENVRPRIGDHQEERHAMRAPTGPPIVYGPSAAATQPEACGQSISATRCESVPRPPGGSTF